MFQPIFDAMAQEVFSPTATSALTSVESFLEATGLKALVEFVQTLKQSRGTLTALDLSQIKDLPPQLLATLQEKRYIRGYLLHLVATYKGCLSRTTRSNAQHSPDERRAFLLQSPWAVHLRKVLPTFFNMVRLIHGLWDSRYWDAADRVGFFPKEFESLLAISPTERLIILGSSPSEASEEDHLKWSRNPHTVEDWLYQLRNWLRLFRETLYAALGQATYLVPGDCFYGPPEGSTTLAQQMMENVFGSVTCLSNLHWRSLLVLFLKPFIQNCPTEHLNSVLGTILPALVTFVGNKLHTEWNEVLQRGDAQIGTMEEADAAFRSLSSLTGSEGADKAETSDEIVNQKILRDFTRAWSDLWSSVFCPAKGVPYYTIRSDCVDILDAARRDAPVPAKIARKLTTVNRPVPDFGGYTDLVHFLLGNRVSIPQSHLIIGYCGTTFVFANVLHDVERHENVHIVGASVGQIDSSLGQRCDILRLFGQRFNAVHTPGTFCFEILF
jgi:hypothetical protein